MGAVAAFFVNLGLFALFVGVLVVGSRLLGARRHPGPDAGACIACGSTDLEVLAPGVYRCRACGYEGGARRGAYGARARRESWATRPWPERIAAAREDVQTALREVLSADEDVDDASGLLDALSYSRLDGGSDLWGAGVGDRLAQARATLLAAAEKVPGLDVPAPDDPAWEPQAGEDPWPAPFVRIARAAAVRLDALAAAHPEAAPDAVDPVAPTDPDPGAG